MIDVVTGNAAAGVGQDLVGHPLAGGNSTARCADCWPAAKTSSAVWMMSHSLERTWDSLAMSFTSGHQSGLGGNDLRHGGLAAGVGMTVIVGEHQGPDSRRSGRRPRCRGPHMNTRS